MVALVCGGQFWQEGRWWYQAVLWGLTYLAGIQGVVFLTGLFFRGFKKILNYNQELSCSCDMIEIKSSSLLPHSAPSWILS